MSKHIAMIGAVMVLSMIPMRSPAADEAKKPTLLVRMKSIDGLLDDILFVAKGMGMDEEVKQVDGIFRSMLGDKTEALDTKRPIGLVGSISEDVFSSGATLLLPIGDEKAFLDLLDRFNVQAKKDADGVYTVSTDNLQIPVPVYMRLGNKYAYITVQNKSNLAKDKLADPVKVLATESQATISAVFRLQDVPSPVKEFLRGALDLKMDEEQNKTPGGITPAQQGLRKEMIKLVAQQASSLLADGGEVRLTLGVDRQKNELYEEFTLSGKPGTKLAETIAKLSQAKSQFASLPGAQTAASFLVHLALPDSIRTALKGVVDEGIGKGLENERDAGRRQLAQKFFAAVDPTLKAGELDAALVLNGPNADKRYSPVVAVKIAQGQMLDDFIRSVVPMIPEKDRERIKLDAETAGDVKIHRLDVQGHLPPEAKEVLGDTSVFVAIAPTMVVAAAGPDGLAGLKAALSAQAKTGPLVQAEISPGRLAPIISLAALRQGNKEAADALAKLAQESAAAKSQDHFRLVLEGGNTLKYRQSVKVPALKYALQLAKMGSQRNR
jgi:hypothetical protein